jgi:hypothetical protein
MAAKIFGPRKQRTRAHVIADQSVNHVERFIIDEGHTAQRLEKDYGYDLLLFTYDEQGYAEPDFLWLQLKAAESFPAVGADYVFDLDVRDYNLWMLEKMPVILILFDASRRRAYWLSVQRYFREQVARQPKKGAKTIRVRVPKRQTVNRRTIAHLRDLKWAAHRQPTGEES